MDYDLSVFAILGSFMLIIFIVALIMYVLLSIGLYRLAANQGIENPWLAWIPVANLYILGRIIKTLKVDSYEIPRIELVLPIGGILSVLLSPIPVIGWIFTIAYIVVSLMALYKLYKMYRPDSAVVWLIVSIILPFMEPIFIFIIRNDSPKVIN